MELLEDLAADSDWLQSKQSSHVSRRREIEEYGEVTEGSKSKKGEAKKNN